jgi:hypothetical protein
MMQCAATIRVDTRWLQRALVLARVAAWCGWQPSEHTVDRMAMLAARWLVRYRVL